MVNGALYRAQSNSRKSGEFYLVRVKREQFGTWLNHCATSCGRNGCLIDYMMWMEKLWQFHKFWLNPTPSHTLPFYRFFPLQEKKNWPIGEGGKFKITTASLCLFCLLKLWCFHLLENSKHQIAKYRIDSGSSDLGANGTLTIFAIIYYYFKKFDFFFYLLTVICGYFLAGSC